MLLYFLAQVTQCLETFFQKVFLGIEILDWERVVIVKAASELIFGGFNAKFKDTLTSNDWLI